MLIKWHDVPDEIRTSIEPMIRRWEHLLPTWVHFIVVEYDHTDPGSASIKTFVEYRWAKVWINASWLLHTEEERSNHVRHEFLHAPLWPMSEFCKHLIENHVEDEAARKTLHEQWRLAYEGATTDLEHALRASERP